MNNYSIAVDIIVIFFFFKLNMLYFVLFLTKISDPIMFIFNTAAANDGAHFILFFLHMMLGSLIQYMLTYESEKQTTCDKYSQMEQQVQYLSVKCRNTLKW